MKSTKLLKKIKSYAFASFLVPLIAVNSCLLIYKTVGYISIYPNFDWDKEEIEFTYNDFNLINSNPETFTFTNCPKYKKYDYYTTIDNQIIKDTPENVNLRDNLIANNKIKSIIFKFREERNDGCVKNYPFLYSVLKKSSSLETILVRSKQNYEGFVKIKNPYFYGEVSISRTARYFPAILIFKTLIILSAFLLFLFWKNNLDLFSDLKNKNILVKFSKKFFYFGVFSCIFLILHATFLGVDFDSKLFDKIRKLIITLFIFFEISAQILLTKNLFAFKEELKKYINPLILKTKIIFVTIIFFITCAAFIVLAFGDPSSAFKHILEWNYFTFLLLFYLLSTLFWKKDKT